MKLQSLLLSVFVCVTAASLRADVIRKGHPVTGRYIVLFEPATTGAAARALAHEVAARSGGDVAAIWDGVHGISGVVLQNLPEQAAEALTRHPNVRQVEEDSYMQLAATQTSAPWHLDRIDQATLPLDTTYSTCTSGINVLAYVVDTGVRASHQEFWLTATNSTSRVETGYQVPGMTGANGTANNPCPNPMNDCYAPGLSAQCVNAGHGTAVASVIGGRTYGAAKGVTIVPVRVANCAAAPWSIKESDTVSGLQWVLGDYPTRNKPAVVNISMETDVVNPSAADTALDTAVLNLINAGVTVVAAAGNGNTNVNHISPARKAEVITVAGSTPSDSRWICDPASGDSCSGGASNFGPGVDIFAPSRDVMSAHIIQLNAAGTAYEPSNTATRPAARSGTSFAAPLVTARLARVMENSFPGSLTAAYLTSRIKSDASPVIPDDTYTGTTNLLIFQPRMVSRYCQ